MAVSYNMLWKLLIDKNLKKKDLIKMAKISTSTLAKMSKDQNVSMDVIIRVCIALECNIGDIMDIVSDKNVESIFKDA